MKIMEWLLDFGEKISGSPFLFFGARTNITPLKTLPLLRSLARGPTVTSATCMSDLI